MKIKDLFAKYKVIIGGLGFTIIGVTFFSLRLNIVEKLILYNQESSQTTIVNKVDQSKEWDVKLNKNTPISNSCYTCQLLFTPTDNINELKPNTKGKLLLADIPYPIKIRLKNNVKIDGINVYAVTENSTKLISLDNESRDLAGNISVPLEHGKNILSVGVSKKRESHFYSKEGDYISLYNERQKQSLYKMAKKNKLMNDFDENNEIYLGLIQYYEKSPEEVKFGLPNEPKISFNIVQIKDTAGESYLYLLGTKVSYSYIYSNGREIDDGGNVEHVLLKEEEFVHEDDYFKEFIKGKVENDKLTKFIMEESSQISIGEQKLNSAARYYHEGNINEKYIEEKYNQIIEELKKIKE